MSRDVVAGLIVIFNPCYDKLEALIASLENEISEIVLVNNGERNLLYEQKKISLEAKGVTFVEMNGNVGVATALNVGVQRLGAAGYEYCWLFDQDSVPKMGSANTLLRNFSSQKNDDSLVAAAVPVIVDSIGQQNLPMLVEGQGRKVQEVLITKRREVAAAITSGMMVKTKIWLETGGAKERYFIDFVDTEWCFRVRSAGYKIMCDPESTLFHILGDASPQKFKHFKRVLRQRPPMRTYHFIRNGVFLASEPYAPENWRNYVIKKILKIALVGIVFGPRRLAQCSAIITATMHILRARLGADEKI